MGRRIYQRTLVVLTVDLDKRRAQRFQGLCAHRLIVDEGAGAAICELHAAQDQLILGRNVVRSHESARGMARRQLESCGHLPLRRACAHQRHIATRAERKREGVEQDGFAGAGLARERGQAASEINVQPVDQDDVANRKPGQHPWLLMHAVVPGPVRAFTLADSSSSERPMTGASPDAAARGDRLEAFA